MTAAAVRRQYLFVEGNKVLVVSHVDKEKGIAADACPEK